MGVEEALPEEALEGAHAHRLARVQEVEALDVKRLPDGVPAQQLVPPLAHRAHLCGVFWCMRKVWFGR